MEKIQLKLDFMHGPIWKEYFDINSRKWSSGINIIDNDAIVSALDAEIQEIYNGLYSFDSDEENCTFSDSKLVEKKNDLLAKMELLVDRLNTINDGSFEIEDFITQELKTLK